MLFVEEFNRLSAQMHESEVKLDQFVRPQREKIAALQTKKAEIKKELKGKNEVGNQGTSDFDEEKKQIKEIEDQIEELRAVEQKKKRKHYENNDWSIKWLLEKSKGDSHALGKAMAVHETIELRLKCHICYKICSEENPMVAHKDTSNTGLSSKFIRSCFKCSDNKELKADEESKKKIAELELIKQLIDRLEG